MMAKSVKPQAAPGRAAGTTARPAVEPGVEACGNGERGGPPRRVGPPGVDACDLARLMTWLSPAFPVGSFSYSHALEWVVEAGTIQDAAALGDWIADVLVYGAGRSDAIFLAQAWRAVAAADARRLAEVASLAAAFAISAERRLETLAQGTAFLGAVMAVWPHPALKGLTQSSVPAPPRTNFLCWLRRRRSLRPSLPIWCPRAYGSFRLARRMDCACRRGWSL